MRVGENGRFQSRFFPRWNERVFRGVLDYFKLDPRAKASHLSRGERAGLALALTLAPEPEVLVLDDPTLGLDPVARRSVLEAMVYLSERSDRTVLFSSHILGDVERIADQIAILDHGRLRALTTTAGFRERVRRVVLRFAGPPPEPPALPGLLQSVRSERELSLTIANYDGRHEQALAALGAEQTETVPLDFEEAFVNYVDDRGQRAFFLSDVGSGGV
jgi:ABC-2 type transport system ATP-binding protein